MRLESRSWKRLRFLRSGFLLSWSLFCAAGRSDQGPYGEVIDVRSGFTRVVGPSEGLELTSSDVQAVWKGRQQTVREVIGGPDSAIEVGIAVDVSASMQQSLDAMKTAIGGFIRSELSKADRVFLLTFSDRIEFGADGRDASLSALAELSIDTRSGLRPTRFFDGVEKSLSYFRNSSPRAVLFVASDGCDSLQEKGAGERILKRASSMAIPVILMAPGRRECRSETCKLTRSGQWSCSEATPSGMSVRVQDRDASDPTRGPIDIPSEFLASPATIARDQFIGRLKAGGGDFVLARSDSEWSRGVDSVRTLLNRQWMVVFEPSSTEVRSSEVRVKVRKQSQSTGVARPSRVAKEEQTKAEPFPATAAPIEQVKPIDGPEEIGVEVVSVDVVATDRRGRRITDIARDELRLEVDNNPQAIDYFLPSGGLAEERQSQDHGSQVVAAASGGTIFLVVDRSTLDARVLKQVVDSFREIAAAPHSAGKAFVVASFGDSPAVLELPRFGGRFLTWDHTNVWDSELEPRRGSSSPPVPRKRGEPASSSAESVSA